MKYIFDFDDVLFDTKKFKKRILECVAKEGISPQVEKEEYARFRARRTPFSLREFLTHLLADEVKVGRVYEDVMRICQTCVNMELVRLIRNLGSKDLFIVTEGEDEFQRDKINRSGIGALFDSRNIFTIQGTSKTEKIEEIYVGKKDKKEVVFFLDNEQRHLDDIDEGKFPTIKKILYVGPETVRVFDMEIAKELNKDSGGEIKRK